MISPLKNSNILKNLFSTTSIWFFHVKFSSLITPRNLPGFSLLISMLLNVMDGSCNRRESHIGSLQSKTYFFVFSENLASFNSLLRIWKRFVSSANIFGSKCVTLWRSLTKIRNKKGPKIEPWGIPILIVSSFL